MRRDDTLRMAREAGLCTSTGACALVGGADLTPFLQRFADLAVADFLARTPPQPIMVSAADIDPALLRDMLSKSSRMPPLLPAEPIDEEIAAAVAAERAAIIRICREKRAHVRHWANCSSTGHIAAANMAEQIADAVSSRGAA